MPFPDLIERVAGVREQIAAAVARGGHGQDVRIVAVTKTHSVDAVNAAVAAGLADVGENKVREALAKIGRTDARVRWHLIGHLQRNKVKHIGEFHLFHALDSLRLADAIDARLSERGEAVQLLVQVNVSGEETKGGFTLEDLDRSAERLASLRGISIRGVMTMAPLDASESELRGVFAGVRRARDMLAAAGFEAHELSMGMSNDYVVAVEEGATIVRLGTILFGERTV